MRSNSAVGCKYIPASAAPEGLGWLEKWKAAHGSAGLQPGCSGGSPDPRMLSIRRLQVTLAAWTPPVQPAGRPALHKHGCYFSTPNVNVVVECIVSPGLSSVLGKSGWFGESGKCCVSRQNPACFSYFTPCRPVKLPFRKLPE